MQMTDRFLKQVYARAAQPLAVFFVALLLAPVSGCGLFSSVPKGEMYYSEEAGEFVPVPSVAPQNDPPTAKSVEAPAEKPAPPEEPPVSSFATIGGEPVLQVGYRIRVAVMVNEAVEVDPTELQISDQLEITLPLIGKVSCDGLTLTGLRSRLVSRYSEFIREPEVTVSFVYSPDAPSPYGQVYVQGRVVREGWVNIPPTRILRLSQAIQYAGGFATSAKKNSIRVTRRDQDGALQTFSIDMESIGKTGSLDKDIALKPNDVVYVRESNF